MSLNNIHVFSSDIQPAPRRRITFGQEKTKEFSYRLSAPLNDQGPEVHRCDINITSRHFRAPQRQILNLDDALVTLKNLYIHPLG